MHVKDTLMNYNVAVSRYGDRDAARRTLTGILQEQESSGALHRLWSHSDRDTKLSPNLIFMNKTLYFVSSFF